MKTYQVGATHSHYTLTAGNTPSATMHCRSWFSYRTEVQVQQQQFLFSCADYFGMQFQMLSGNKLVATSRMGWTMCTTIHLGNRSYTLKGKNWYSADFVLLNEQLAPVMTLHSRSSFKNTYDISADEAFTPEEILFIVYNANHIKSSNSAGAITAIAVMLALPAINGGFHLLLK